MSSDRHKSSSPLFLLVFRSAHSSRDQAHLIITAKWTASAGTRSFLSDATTTNAQFTAFYSEREKHPPCGTVGLRDHTAPPSARLARGVSPAADWPRRRARRPIAARPRARFVCLAGASTARSFTPNGCAIISVADDGRAVRWHRDNLIRLLKSCANI